MGTKALLLKAIPVATLALVADQALKIYVRQSLARCPAPPLSACPRLELVGPLGFVRVENAGSAFGFLQGWWLWVAIAVLGLLLIPVYARRLRRADLGAALAVGLQVGGAAGNLVDRLAYGGATDFIDLGVGPIFNLADIFIVLGMLLAVRGLRRAMSQNQKVNRFMAQV